MTKSKAWHREKRLVLHEPIQTERFILRSETLLGAFRLALSLNRSAQARYYLRQQKEPWNVWRVFRRTTRPNKKSRFVHAIVDRQSGKAIGVHETRLQQYRTLTLSVAIFDTDWWGKGVVQEVRPALIAKFCSQTGAKQIFCQVRQDNHASIANHRKMGSEVIGVNPYAYWDEDTGRPGEMVFFSLHGENLEKLVKQNTK